MKHSRRSNFGHGGFVVSMVESTRNNIMDASSQVLLFAPVCSQVVLLDECNIALFAFGFSFGPIGGRYL